MKFRAHLGMEFIDAEWNHVRNWQLVNELGYAVAIFDLCGPNVTRFLTCSKAPDNARGILQDADNSYKGKEPNA